MTIQVGQNLRNAIKNGDPTDDTIFSICRHKKILLLFVTAAFDPKCDQHITTYINQYHEFKSRGVERIIVISVNDHIVMQAWPRSLGAPDQMYFVHDNNAELVTRLGLQIDLSEYNLGVRSKCCVMIVEGGIVTYLNVEPDITKITDSGAEKILAHLQHAE